MEPSLLKTSLDQTLCLKKLKFADLKMQKTITLMKRKRKKKKSNLNHKTKQATFSMVRFLGDWSHTKALFPKMEEAPREKRLQEHEVEYWKPLLLKYGTNYEVHIGVVK